jgi:phage terminase Nu1 subunit (DNA packaging protein)
MIELASADVICSAQQLSEVLGVTPRRIDVLAEDGVLKAVRSSKFKGRRYRLNDAVQRFCAYQKQYVKAQCSSRNGNGEYNDARARRMAATAIIEEARARQISGEMISRESAMISMTNVVSVIRNHVLAIPNRLSRVLAATNDVSKAHSILKSACRSALQSACDFVLEKSTQESRSGERDDADTSTQRERKERL